MSPVLRSQHVVQALASLRASLGEGQHWKVLTGNLGQRHRRGLSPFLFWVYGKQPRSGRALARGPSMVSCNDLRSRALDSGSLGAALLSEAVRERAGQETGPRTSTF